jgi:hypothetical protein
VIHVRVRDDDVANAVVLIVGEAEGDASGVYGDAIVDDETGQPLFLTGAAVSVEGAGKKLDFHGGISVSNFAPLSKDVELPA